jgi:hypothetical protein
MLYCIQPTHSEFSTAGNGDRTVNLFGCREGFNFPVLVGQILRGRHRNWPHKFVVDRKPRRKFAPPLDVVLQELVEIGIQRADMLNLTVDRLAELGTISFKFRFAVCEVLVMACKGVK